MKNAQRSQSHPFQPRNAIGMVKTLPVPEMEELLMTHAVIKDDDLRATLPPSGPWLSKICFVKSDQVTPDRIFIVEPKTLEPEKMKNSRTVVSISG